MEQEKPTDEALNLELERLQTRVAQIKAELAVKESNRIIKNVNENRSKILDQFIEAWLGAVAPPGFDYAWVMRNIVLCHRTVYEEGKMTDQHWIELVKPK